MRAAAVLLVLAIAGAAPGLAHPATAGFRQADARRALAIGLSLKDVGTGWSEATGGKSPRTVDLGSLFGNVSGGGTAAACVGKTPPTPAETDLVINAGSVSGFSTPTGSSIASVVMLMKTGAVASREFAGSTSGSAVQRCIGAELSSALGGNAKLGRTTKLDVPTGSQLSAAYRTTARIGPATLYFDTFIEADGRAMAETFFVGLGAPPARPLEQRLTGLLASRMKRDVPPAPSPTP
jgi:hypothetical protein